jgi:hypothetical protein
VKALLAKFNFINKFLAYGKDESKNLAILKETNFIKSCHLNLKV